MNKAQKIIVATTLAMVALVTVFPPWSGYYDRPPGWYPSPRGFLFAGPRRPAPARVRVNIRRLGVEWIAIIAVGATAFGVFQLFGKQRGSPTEGA